MFSDNQAPKIRVKKTAELLADQIRNAIVRGDLKIGDSLPTEAELVVHFEVSRPTIREAVRILESENLLQLSRGKRGGARISAPSTEMVAKPLGVALQSRGTTLGDVYAARMIIEPPAARMAAELRPQEASAALRAHLAIEISLLDDRAHVARAITAFHRLLVEQSGNQTLALVADALSDISEKHLAFVHRSHQNDDPTLQIRRTRRGFKSQERLAKLIGDGDGVAAENHWREHMAKVGEYWLQGMASSGLEILE